MLWLWILGIILLLLVLLMRIRVGVRAAFGAVLTLDVKIGPFYLSVFPLKEKAKKPPKAPKKKPKKAKKPKAPFFPKPNLSDILDAAQTMWPPLRKAMARTWQGIRLDPMRLSLTVAGREDPAAAAQLYGRMQAGLWTIFPQLERLMDMPDPHVHIDVDFTASENLYSGQVGIHIRIGTLMRVGLGVAIPALRWFLRYRKTKKRQAVKT